MRRFSTIASWAVAAFLCPWMATPLWAGEDLVYAVVYKGSGLEAARTDIFAVSPEAVNQRLIFSDEKVPIVLAQRFYAFHFPVIGGGKLLAHAQERGQVLQSPYNGSLYELSTDGSGRFRRIAPVSGVESLGEIFASPDGKRVGYINSLKQGRYIFIHDTSTGKLLRQVDVTNKFLDCFAATIGWLPSGDTLFFSLDTGDMDVTTEESYGRVGTYLMDEGGHRLTKVADPPQREGFWPPEGVRMLGQLPGGEYVLETMQHAKRTRPGADRIVVSLVRLDPRSGRARDLAFAAAAAMQPESALAYNLSPSGRYLAAATLASSASSVSQDIWVKDFQTGKETKLLSLPRKASEGPFLGLVGWITE